MSGVINVGLIRRAKERLERIWKKAIQKDVHSKGLDEDILLNRSDRVG